MTHQRPIPEDQTSPYPIQPAPIEASSQDDPTTVETEASDSAPDGSIGGLSTRVLTVGAAIGVGAVAAVGGLIYSRRARNAKAEAKTAKAPAKPRKAPSGKVGGGKKANGAKKAPAAKASTPAAAATASKATASKRKSGDDKTMRDGRDRARVSASEPYELKYFARKHGLSADDARDIIKAAGSDRKKANKLAEDRSR